MYRFGLLLASVAALVGGGCASTTVRQNPGEHDHGFRFYRPKPYLFVQPAGGPAADADAPDYVSIDWMMLPDFSEQYSIHARAGLGINESKITLADGWNLTQVDYSIDSRTDENIKSIGGLIKAAATVLGKSSAPVPPAAERIAGALVPAHNVPFGFYEAVIDRDPSGTKRLYGFRYLGFMPYGPCPIAPTGSQAECCQTAAVYGLVNENGMTVFKRLDHLAASEVQAERPAAKPLTKEKLQAALTEMGLTLRNEANKHLTMGNTVVTVTPTAVSASEVQVVVLVSKMEANKAGVELALTTALEKVVLDNFAPAKASSVKVTKVTLTVNQ